MARPNPSVFSEHLKRNMNHGSGFLASDFGIFLILYMFIYIRCATVILHTSCELFFVNLEDKKGSLCHYTVGLSAQLCTK